MADECAVAGPSAKESDSNSDYDPTLDFFSEQFDPLKALQTADLTIPVPSARTHDNLSKYYSCHTGAAKGRKSSKAAEPAPVLFQRRFLPHQMPVAARKKKRKNVLSRMESMQGPLAALKRCVDERIRIKVWTRHSHGLRGYCLAYVSAFDKHWNLALEDVTEVWTRPRKRKVPAALDTVDSQQTKTKKMIVPPKIVVTKTKGKVEFCERSVPQLLVRGEQIAFINIDK